MTGASRGIGAAVAAGFAAEGAAVALDTLTGAFVCARAVWPDLRSRGYGN